MVTNKENARMSKIRKITIDVPGDLLEQAQAETSAGISETVRVGLKLLAAASAMRDLRKLKGKIKFSKSASELKGDE
jgi:hypothetical protein